MLLKTNKQTNKQNMKTNTTDTNSPETTTPTAPRGVYQLTDAISGETTKVIPKQLRETAARLGITVDELIPSYVGHSGKRALREMKLTEEQAVAKFTTLHPAVVANCKRCFVKVKPRKQTADVPAPVAVEVPAVEVVVIPPIEDSTNDEVDAILVDTEQ